jgi:preprotein translocase subunit YajC
MVRPAPPQSGSLHMSLLISPAHAQDATGGISSMLSGSGLTQFLPLILIFVVFYFMMIRPQQLAQKSLKAQIAAVKRGDRVLTAGGIIATVQKVRDPSGELEVEIAPNVRVIVMRDTLTSVLNGTPAAANDAK